VSKILIIAEKPSVGTDISGALPGAFEKNKGYLESDNHVITWAVGHLVTLAAPEDYDEKLKKWKFDDLPIVPDEFKLKPRDAKSTKQLNIIHKLLVCCGLCNMAATSDLSTCEAVSYRLFAACAYILL